MSASLEQFSTTNAYPPRFETLDAFRGLAALGVVVHHVAQIYIGGPSVMIFFVISGYCIAAAGASCRRAGHGIPTFMWRRIRRIMPPYLLSIALWAVYRLIKLSQGGPNELVRPWTDWIQNLTLTQWLTLIRNPAPYPPHNSTLIVGAYWSLCYEEQFYIIMGLLVVVAGLSALASRWAVVALLAVGIAWNLVVPDRVYGIFIEYWAPFALGCLIYYRLCELPTRAQSSQGSSSRNALARRAIDAFLLVACAASAVMLTRAGGFPKPLLNGDELRSVPGEWLVASAFALVLLALRPIDAAIARSTWFVPFRALGKITFSLYLVHQFNLIAVRKIAAALVGQERFNTPIGWLIQIALLLVVGTMFWWLCERPFLNKPLAERKQTRHAPSPSS